MFGLNLRSVRYTHPSSVRSPNRAANVAHQAVQGIGSLATPLVAHPLGVEQHEQVQLARVSKLARAESAHAEHGEPARRCRFVIVGRCEGAAGCGFPKEMVESAGERGVGEAGEGRGHGLWRPCAGELGERRGERRPPLGRPKPPGEGAAVAIARSGTRQRVEHALECGVRAALGQDAKLGRLAAQ